MTTTVTIRARALPVTIKVSDDADLITVDPWQGRRIHVDGSMSLTITEVEPAAAPEPTEEQSSDETVAAANATRDAEEATATYGEEVTNSSRRGRRAPAADSDDTQVG